ncbi:hypothetical protein [Micromonospora cathayae]|uniref:MYXO-CTERM domain-containing protein n=1 Tax=Micromonospora cathayae TaxID=3028804 RepID=A0ABY7ZUL9_9ACTN|nr:hypothetical protein [Micromonospora sp. HUAS 3]WDZ85733.1 hypothetical protein PVK37_04605 [Micromonospora sp. HUAS 3]
MIEKRIEVAVTQGEFTDDRALSHLAVPAVVLIVIVVLIKALVNAGSEPELTIGCGCLLAATAIRLLRR